MWNLLSAEDSKAVSEKPISVAEIEPLVKDFASRWKAAIELMHTDVIKSFSNFLCGMEILRAALTQLLLYYTRLLDCIKEIPGGSALNKDLVSIPSIMYEIKKYSRTFWVNLPVVYTSLCKFYLRKLQLVHRILCLRMHWYTVHTPFQQDRWIMNLRHLIFKREFWFWDYFELCIIYLTVRVYTLSVCRRLILYIYTHVFFVGPSINYVSRSRKSPPLWLLSATPNPLQQKQRNW